MLERLNEEIKRRTLVVRIFRNERSCLRLILALAAEMHENWIEETRNLNMEDLRKHKRGQMRRAVAGSSRLTSGNTCGQLACAQFGELDRHN